MSKIEEMIYRISCNANDTEARVRSFETLRFASIVIQGGEEGGIYSFRFMSVVARLAPEIKSHTATEAIFTAEEEEEEDCLVATKTTVFVLTHAHLFSLTFFSTVPFNCFHWSWWWCRKLLPRLICR